MSKPIFSVVIAAVFGLGSVAAQAQNIAAVNFAADKVAYNNGATIDVSRHGHQIIKVDGRVMLFDPSTHTLTNPIRMVNERLSPQVTPNGQGFAKTYQTEAVPGSGCPVALDWNVGYNMTETTATVAINGVPTQVKVQKSEQNARWACGQYGGDTATISVEYAPDLGVLVSFTMDMRYKGQSNIVGTKLVGITQAAARTTQAPAGPVVAAANKQ